MSTEKNEIMSAAETEVKVEATAPAESAQAKEATAPVEEAAAETAASAEETAPAEETAEAPAAAPRRRQAQRPARRREAEVTMDYMQGYVPVESSAENYRAELRHMNEIITNNVRVAKTGRGEMRFITAMMTANNEKRAVAGNPNSLTDTMVFGREVLADHESLGILELVFEGSDFLAYSGLDDGEGSELYRRQRQYSSHAAGSKFLCAPVRIIGPEESETGMPKVLCSRAFAMEYFQDKFFFAENPLAREGGHGIAYVMAGYPSGVRVEFGGIETFIPRGQLTSRKLITNAAEIYKPGTGLEVSITKLNVDHEKRTIELRLSGVQREVELGLVTNVKSIRLQDKPRRLAEVMVTTDSVSVVRIIDLGIIGLIPRQNVLPAGGEPLKSGDRVWMEITGVNEETNRVIGSCIKIS